MASTFLREPRMSFGRVHQRHSAALVTLDADFTSEQQTRIHSVIEQSQVTALSLDTVDRSAVADVLAAFLSKAGPADPSTGAIERALHAAIIARALLLPDLATPQFDACSRLFRGLMHGRTQACGCGGSPVVDHGSLKPAAAGPLDDRVTRALELIAEAHTRSSFSEAWVAKRVQLSPTRLSRLFAAHTGMYFHAYVRAYRIRRSLPLLFESRLTIRKIAESVGYCHTSTFDRHFSELLGCRPRDFRACVWCTAAQWVGLSVSQGMSS